MRENINDGSSDNDYYSMVAGFLESIEMLSLKINRARSSYDTESFDKQRKGGGGDGDGGSSGGGYDGDDDNNGGDKTEGGGVGGGGGKMGTKMEPKGQHDNRNRFSYHAGDKNGYPLGKLYVIRKMASVAGVSPVIWMAVVVFCMAVAVFWMATKIKRVGKKLKAMAMAVAVGK